MGAANPAFSKRSFDGWAQPILPFQSGALMDGRSQSCLFKRSFDGWAQPILSFSSGTAFIITML
jgi:hypothetical protein